MSKPGVVPSCGISLGDALRRPKRHPACRRREAQPGSCTERENLIGDAKGKGASGSNREAESTDAPARGRLLRSSDEAGVMPVERRERAIAIWLGSTGNGRNPMFNGRRQPSRECQVRFCEGLGVKFPGPTRQSRRSDPARLTSGLPRLTDFLMVIRHVPMFRIAGSCTTAVGIAILADIVVSALFVRYLCRIGASLLVRE